MTQITTTVTEVKTTITAITESDRSEQNAIAERSEAIIAEPLMFTAIKESDQGGQSANIGERIREALVGNPDVTDRELASMVGCSSSTANKWRKRIEQAA